MKHLSRKAKESKYRKSWRKKAKKSIVKTDLSIALLPKNSNGSSNWEQLSKVIGQHLKKEDKLQSKHKKIFKNSKKIHTNKLKTKPQVKQDSTAFSKSHNLVTTNLKDTSDDNLSSMISNSNDVSSVTNSLKMETDLSHGKNKNSLKTKKKKKHKNTDSENLHLEMDEIKLSCKFPQNKQQHNDGSIKDNATKSYAKITKQNVLHSKNNSKESTVSSKAQNICAFNKSSKDSSSNKPSTSNNRHGLSNVIAMDCEMVGTGVNGEDSMLARVSLVNGWGDCVYDAYVKPIETITDYRTAVSGIRSSDLIKGKDLFTVQKEVHEIIDGKILVGHALKNDLSVLFISHPHLMIRDTSKYNGFRRMFNGRTPSLKKLAEEILGVQIQTGEHSSVEDAQATMQIYLAHKKEWEGAIKYHRKKRLKSPSLSTNNEVSCS